RPGGSAVRAGARAAADEPRPGGAAPLAAPGAFREPRAAPVVGTTPTGDAVKLDFDGAAAQPTLLAFLSSGCGTCARFWQALGEREPPAGVRPVIVTRGGDRERPARLRTLAPAGVPVVMSSPAWQDYAVPGAPYFLLIDGEVRGEGVATTWEGLVSLVADAIEDARLIERSAAGPRRARRVDATLAAHGIGPGHPSLYPGRQAR
ncbi:MAG: hypothetical protein JO168_05870, partial [Solirubrobacterales bacterium]|nr:hypothetical protein [Solirubrobacterales bacterium]